MENRERRDILKGRSRQGRPGNTEGDRRRPPQATQQEGTRIERGLGRESERGAGEMEIGSRTKGRTKRERVEAASSGPLKPAGASRGLLDL